MTSDTVETPALSPRANLPALGVLAFAAIAWIVVNQFGLSEHLGVRLGPKYGLVFKGYLGAELFFIVTGVLTADYWFQNQSGHTYRSLLLDRFGAIYPLHLITLAAMGALAWIGHVLHAPVSPDVVRPADLPANLLLIQAWGAVGNVSWNFPAWLVSAAWFGFLLFPVSLIVAKVMRSAWLGLAVAVALFMAAFWVADRHGVLFSDMTAQIGALQTAPAYLCGICLQKIVTQSRAPGWVPVSLTGLALVWIIATAMARLSDMLIWPGLVILTLGVAWVSPLSPRGRLSAMARHLGRLPWALCLTYLPTNIVYFHLIDRLSGRLHGLLAGLGFVGAFAACVLVAEAGYLVIQKPCVRLLRLKLG